MKEGGLEKRRQRPEELRVSGLEEQQRKLDDVAVPEVEVDPEADAQVAAGQDEEYVALVETTGRAKQENITLSLSGHLKPKIVFKTDRFKTEHFFRLSSEKSSKKIALILR